MSELQLLPATGASTYRPAEGMPPALFLPDGTDGVVSTELTRGPWAHRVMHGGPICGALGRTVELGLGRQDLVCTRFTVDILSGIPVEPLRCSHEVRKAGKRTALVDGFLEHEGRLVARATSQWLAPGPADQGGPIELPPVPGDRDDPGAHPDMTYPRPGFNADAIDLRVVEGSTEEPGPGRIWIRLAHPLVEGESTTTFQRLTTLCDLGAAVGWEPSDSDAHYINTDVTLQLVRRPQGEWFFFESSVVHGADGVACCRSTISDVGGVLGWIMQSQMQAPPEIRF